MSPASSKKSGVITFPPVYKTRVASVKKLCLILPQNVPKSCEEAKGKKIRRQLLMNWRFHQEFCSSCRLCNSNPVAKFHLHPKHPSVSYFMCHVC